MRCWATRTRPRSSAIKDPSTGSASHGSTRQPHSPPSSATRRTVAGRSLQTGRYRPVADGTAATRSCSRPTSRPQKGRSGSSTSCRHAAKRRKSCAWSRASADACGCRWSSGLVSTTGGSGPLSAASTERMWRSPARTASGSARRSKHVTKAASCGPSFRSRRASLSRSSSPGVRHTSPHRLRSTRCERSPTPSRTGPSGSTRAHTAASGPRRSSGR